MVVSAGLENHWSQQNSWKSGSEVLASLDAMWLFAPFRKQVELLLATADEKDALHHDVQQAIISWNQKIMGVPQLQLQEAVYKTARFWDWRADDYDIAKAA